MDYVIFDLEWNQCPYGKGKENPKLPFEIIEIGAVKMDGERNVVGTFHRIVKPVVYQHLHHRTREVVGLTEEDLQMKVSIDMRLPFPYINEELIHELKILEPFGKGNGKPLFAESKLRVIQPRIFGKNRNVLKCRLEDQQGNQMEAVYFGEVEECLRQMEKKQIMSFTYYPSINEYMGRRTIQLTIVNYQ